MQSRREALLSYARTRVTIADIKAQTICIDPGYPGYVEAFTNAWQTGDEAAVYAVDWEPIFHACGDEPTEDPAHQRFRVFTAALGLLPTGCGDFLSPNALALTLLEESAADPALAHLAFAALAELATDGTMLGDGDVPFLLLAQLVLSLRTPLPEVDLDALIERFMDAEASARRKQKFLWSCTSFRQGFARWKAQLSRHLTPSTPKLAALRAAILDA